MFEPMFVSFAKILNLQLESNLQPCIDLFLLHSVLQRYLIYNLKATYNYLRLLFENYFVLQRYLIYNLKATCTDATYLPNL